MTAKEMVDHPSHYNSHPSGIECIDIVEEMNFNLGNAFKYLFRYREKANPVQDLNKAVWYANRECERINRRGDLAGWQLPEDYQHMLLAVVDSEPNEWAKCAFDLFYATALQKHDDDVAGGLHLMAGISQCP
jgi:hypothetical protein